MLRTALARNARLFSTSVRVNKSATDAAKDAVGTVHKVASDAALKGFEKADEAKEAIKSTTGTTSQKAEGMAEEAKGKTQQAAAEAKAKGAEMADKAKEKAP